MDTEEQTARIRTLRAKGLSPKDIARVLGVPPATAARLVRAIAAEQNTDPAQRDVLHCWVNPGCSVGLTIHGHRQWPDLPQPQTGAAGLVAVLVARDAGRSRVSVCGYLVEVYCLGVKNTIGPRVWTPTRPRSSPVCSTTPTRHRRWRHRSTDPEPGARRGRYAQTLGIDPAPDFDATRTNLGPWSDQGAITFGRNGRPYFIQGPHDNPPASSELLRSVGPDNFEYLIAG